MSGPSIYYAGVRFPPGTLPPKDGQVIMRSASDDGWVFKDFPVPDISSPSDGQVFTYNAASNKWVNRAPSGTLGGHTDVDIASPADGQRLIYNAGTAKWENHSPALADETDVRVSSPSDGDVLTFDGTSGLWTNKVPGGGGGGGGGGSILAGVGGFGSDSQGSQIIAYSPNTTVAWGPFNPFPTDSVHTASISAGHLYRIVFFFQGAFSGANLALMAAGLTGASSKGYFVGDAGIYAVNGTGYANIQANGFGQNVLDDSDTPAHDQIVEVYLWVKAASKNRLWAKGFGARWEAVNDTSCDFVANGLQIGYNGGTLHNVYVYELGSVPTS
jgi:hypothetical protein